MKYKNEEESTALTKTNEGYFMTMRRRGIYTQAHPEKLKGGLLALASNETMAMCDQTMTKRLHVCAGSEPMAMCYGGHQFGNWAGQLGDGRAMTLGEIVNSKNERWELQLKGAGPTPYSRTADGVSTEHGQNFLR